MVGKGSPGVLCVINTIGLVAGLAGQGRPRPRRRALGAATTRRGFGRRLVSYRAARRPHLGTARHRDPSLPDLRRQPPYHPRSAPWSPQWAAINGLPLRPARADRPASSVATSSGLDRSESGQRDGFAHERDRQLAARHTTPLATLRSKARGPGRAAPRRSPNRSHHGPALCGTRECAAAVSGSAADGAFLPIVHCGSTRSAVSHHRPCLRHRIVPRITVKAKAVRYTRAWTPASSTDASHDAQRNGGRTSDLCDNRAPPTRDHPVRTSFASRTADIVVRRVGHWRCQTASAQRERRTGWITRRLTSTW
jgi:hypothetical protein